jgi:hypothetical protein
LPALQAGQTKAWASLVPDTLIRDVFDEDNGEAHELADELDFRLHLGRRASSDLTEACDHHSVHPDLGGSDDHAQIWLAVFGVVLVAASISRLLWPNRDPTGAAARLRRGLAAGTVLKDRAVRNAIEHADETLHLALQSHEPTSAWELFIGKAEQPLDQEEPLDQADEDWDAMQPRAMRSFDIHTFQLTVMSRDRTETINLRELAVAMDALRTNLDGERREHSVGMISGVHHEKFFQ